MGHFDGRLKQAVETAVEKAKDKAFYECLTKHGFYDVSDTNNGLKDWERASVPDYNQNRMSALAEAIADMMQDLLANPEYGVLTTAAEDIVKKLDMRGSMTASEMDVVGGVLGGLTGGVSESARQAISAQVAAAMDGFKFDPDVIPPISLGLSGLPFSLSNIYKPGMLAPNYDFLYNMEPDKHEGFFEKDGKLMVGPNIPVDIGGSVKILLLRTIFGVPNVDKDCKPQGDIEGGLSMEEFKVIQDVMYLTPAEALEREDVKNFRMTDKQMRSAFYRYIHFILWQPISNPNNWGFLHWGVLTNNACPEQLRTAVCSFLRTNGLALDPAVNPEACMICHCLNAGMAYYVGRNTAVTLLGVSGQNIAGLDENKADIVLDSDQDAFQCKGGVKKDKRLAELHFTWIADILSRLTLATSENDTEIRKRRVAEANLIYSMLGMPTITYGDPASKLPQEHTGIAVANRGLPSLMDGKREFYVFKNEAANLVSGEDVNIVFQSKNVDPEGKYLQQRTIDVLKYVGAVTGIKTIPITSLYRNVERQGNTMAYNWHHGNRISYGAAGKQVNKVYEDDVKIPENQQKGKPGYVTDARFNSYTRKAMVQKALDVTKNGASYDVAATLSRHCGNYTVLQACDISDKDIQNKYHYSLDQLYRMGEVFEDLKKQGIIRKYLLPKRLIQPPKKGNGEPAFHVEVHITGENSKIPLPMAKSEPGNMSPTKETGQTVVMSNPNFLTANMLDAPFVKDNVDKNRK